GGPRLRDSFLFVNGFSLVCPLRTTPAATCGVGRIALGMRIAATSDSGLSTVHPPPLRTFPPPAPGYGITTSTCATSPARTEKSRLNCCPARRASTVYRPGARTCVGRAPTLSLIGSPRKVVTLHC